MEKTAGSILLAGLLVPASLAGAAAPPETSVAPSIAGGTAGGSESSVVQHAGVKPEGGQAAPAAAKKKKVLVIGLDGTRPNALQAANAVNLDALAANGAYSWTTKANSNYTWSATGWSTIHTGVWYQKHGVTNNNWTGSKFGPYPSLMKRAELYNPALSTASIVHWGPINDKLVEGIDLEKTVATDAEVASNTVDLLKTGIRTLFPSVRRH